MYHIMLFTGQRLDETGLYFYNARYYDPTIGRFISADTIIPDPINPQEFNRYSYCLNNPLRYIDPSGHDVEVNGWDVEVIQALLQYYSSSSS
jgi:RHS repeat-associated protein